MIAYRDGQPTPGLLRLQQAERSIAESLFAFCHSRGLSPFLAAGSALGAWRDGGFIAWDDDIDIGLVREEYEELLKALQSQPLPGIFLQCWRTEPGYPLAFAKLRLQGTRVEEDAWSGTSFHQGIFVDIFPFDRLPRARALRFVQYWALCCVSLFVMSYNSAASQVSTFRSLRWLRRLACAIRPIMPLRALIVLREWLFRLPFASKSDEMVSFEMYGIRVARRTRIARDCLLPPVRCRFDDLEFAVPADCDAYLGGLFGDYRKLPPIERQGPLHIRKVDFGDSARWPAQVSVEPARNWRVYRQLKRRSAPDRPRPPGSG